MSTATARPLSEPQPVALRTPLFESAIERIDDGNRHVVVDLGSARSRTIDLFSGLRCRLDIVGLPSAQAVLEIPAAERQSGKAEMARFLDNFLPPPRGEKISLVLCWNLLNYLQPDAIEVLMQRLARRAGPGTRVHALIEYSATTMPARPWSFTPASREMLTAMPADAPSRPAPRYSSRELEKHMAGFSHERTMLLGNGMQEYLFKS